MRIRSFKGISRSVGSPIDMFVVGAGLMTKIRVLTTAMDQ